MGKFTIEYMHIFNDLKKRRNLILVVKNFSSKNISFKIDLFYTYFGGKKFFYA